MVSCHPCVAFAGGAWCAERERESPIATGEHLLLHVDMAAGRAVAAGAEVLAALDLIAASQRELPRPDGAGRAIGGARSAAGGQRSGAV